MKTGRILIVVLMLLSSAVYAQDKWEERCNENPRMVLSEAEKMYTEAVQEKNSAKLIQALLLQIKCTSLLNEATVYGPEMLKKIEKRIGESEVAAERSLLHSLIAELYSSFYQQQDYIINQRIALTGAIPEDINTWSSNLFIEKIFHHALAAIESKDTLQSIAADEYRLLLIPGEDSRSLRPTLYDLLCHRSLQQLENCNRMNISHFFPEQTMESPEALAPLDRFLTWSFIPAPYSVAPHQFKIYQDLLAFRSREKNLGASLMANLDRLKYAQHLLHSDSIYFSRLRELREEFHAIPYVVEVLYQEAMYYINKTHPPKYEEALALCQQGIRDFPNYQRIGLLKELVAEITKPVANISYKQNIYPGKEQSLQIRYRNIGEVNITLSRINETTADYQFKKYKKEAIRKTQLFAQTYTLPESLQEQDTTFKIPVTESGLYELTVENKKITKATGTFIANQLFTTLLRSKDTLQLMVRDAISGKPAQEAKIIRYNLTQKERYSKTDSLTTDANGMAIFQTSPSNHAYYEVVNRKNPNNELNRVYEYGYRGNHYLSTQQKEINLFTDRSVYRPGQTVYYKGISWNSSPDKNSVRAKEPYTVRFQDANGKQISRQMVQSNDWGSFNGSFVIPDKMLNGQFFLRVEQACLSINVAEYKRPEFEVTFDPQTEAYAFGDEIRVSGQVKSYSGVTLANSQVNYQITQNSLLRWHGEKKALQKGVVQTDSEGRFEIRFQAEQPAGEKRPGWGQYYQVKGAVTDTKGETQEASAVIRISDQSYRLSTELPEQIDRLKPIVIRVKATNSSGTELTEQIDYAIYSLTPLSSITQTYSTKNAVIQDTMRTGILRTNHDSLLLDFSKWKSGAYLFLAKGMDAKNNPIIEKQLFYLYSGKDKKMPLLSYQWIVKEKTHCKPEENAEILLGSSAKDVYLLYELFANNKIQKREYLKLSDEVIRFSIPYEEKYGDNITLILSYVKDQQLFSERIPIYKVKEDKQLTFKTTVFRDKLQPGEKESWEFSIVNAEGQPALSEVMAVMYDQSLDQLSPHRWQFTPVVNRYETAPAWSIWLSPNGFINLNVHNTPQPIGNFRFDALNFYGSHPWERSFSYGSNDFEVTDAGMTRVTMSESPVNRAFKTNFAAGESASSPAELTGAPDKIPVPIRQNFRETAFFYPQLLTNEDGEVTIQFTVPEATTRWKFMAIAHTKELGYGSIEKTITTTKELMVMPNIPRFFRSGDSVVLKTTVSNQSSNMQSGQVTLELFTLPDEQVIFKQQRAFTAAAGETNTVSFNFRVNQPSGVVGCRISAASATFSDGEQHLVPILPNRAMVTEAMPLYATKAGKHEFHMQALPATTAPYRLTLELAANPIWYAVLALPSLQEPQAPNVSNTLAAFYVNTVGAAIVRANPRIVSAIKQWNAQKGNSTTLTSKLEQNSELKSILLEASPWVLNAQGQTERMQSLAQLFDLNRLNYLQAEAMKKLQALQNKDGGWSWFQGWESSPFMTEQVLKTMAKAGITGQKEYQEAEKMMQIKALRYLDEKIQEDFEEKERPGNHLSYLYTRSLYRDIPLGEALEAHKYYMARIEESWTKLPVHEKALAAITLWHYGKSTIAERILTSLKGYATITPEMGMFWGTQLNLSTHVTILEAFHEIKGDNADIDLMKQWLLRQKQTQDWGNIPATVDAIYALLLTGSYQLDEKESLTVAVGRQAIDLVGVDNTLGYVKTNWPASEIMPDMNSVSLTKQLNTPTWGGLYLQYSDRLDRITKTKGAALNIEKNLFIERNTATGQELIPIEKTPLHIGDKIIVRLILTLDRAMEYLHLQELPAACFEPVKQLSGNHWKFGTVYYEDVKDAATNFFFDRLERGTYVLEYPVWINQAGEFQDGIATLQCLYAPEFVSHTTNNQLIIIQ